jgi:mannose-6-phosphate isomerase-like protein (cupin superfamily)
VDRKEIIESGLLELYAMGGVSQAERAEIEQALTNDPMLALEVKNMEEALEVYAKMRAIDPPKAARPLLMAKIDYQERLKRGEQPGHPPTLSAASTIQEFDPWLQRSDMVLPKDFEAMHAIILADEPEKLTALVWLKYGAPEETHTIAHEKFLVVEGTCDIIVESQIHSLKAADYFSIPLHLRHSVKVTSPDPCKIILQRVSA